MLDNALKHLRLRGAINNHRGLARSNSPPSKAVLTSEKIFKPRPVPIDKKVPFQEGELEVNEYETTKWQSVLCQDIQDLILREINQMDKVACCSAEDKEKSNPFDMKRKGIYDFYFSILVSPISAAMPHLEIMLVYEKLLRSKLLKLKQENVFEYTEGYCEIRGCPNRAIHSARYCAWHISNEPNQTLFIPCECCDWPTVNCHWIVCSCQL